jgi:hypothetical protein
VTILDYCIDLIVTLLSLPQRYSRSVCKPANNRCRSGTPTKSYYWGLSGRDDLAIVKMHNALSTQRIEFIVLATDETDIIPLSATCDDFRI